MTIVDEHIRGRGHCPDKVYLFKVCGRTASTVTEAVKFNLHGDGNTYITLPSEDGGDGCSFGVSIPENLARLNISFDVPVDKYTDNDTPVYMCVYGQTSVRRTDMIPPLPCEHCSIAALNNSSFAKGHKRNSSSHLYVKGARNQTEFTIPENQKDTISQAVIGTDMGTMHARNLYFTRDDDVGSFLDNCENQSDNVSKELATEREETDQSIERDQSMDDDNTCNTNNELTSKYTSDRSYISQKRNMMDIDGYDFVDSRLQSLEDNTCIRDELCDIRVNKCTENSDMKGLLDNRNSQQGLSSKCPDPNGKNYIIITNAYTNQDDVDKDEDDGDDDDANNNVRVRSCGVCNDIDNRKYNCDNLSSDLSLNVNCSDKRSHTKTKTVSEFVNDRENNQEADANDKYPEKTKPATHVRLQGAIQRSFTKFLYEIDLMEFSDSLYEQLVLDMNTYECLFEMWQLDKNKLDAKRKLLMYLSRGHVNKENFEKAVWDSSHYPLLDAFFPKT